MSRMVVRWKGWLCGFVRDGQFVRRGAGDEDVFSEKEARRLARGNRVDIVGPEPEVMAGRRIADEGELAPDARSDIADADDALPPDWCVACRRRAVGRAPDGRLRCSLCGAEYAWCTESETWVAHPSAGPKESVTRDSGASGEACEEAPDGAD